MPVPPALLGAVLKAGGRGEIYQRLAGSLVADPAALLRLGWVPPVATPEGLARLARRRVPETTKPGREGRASPILSGVRISGSGR